MTKTAFILWLLLSAADCLACQIGWRSETALKGQAGLVINAKLVAVSSVVRSLRSDIYKYQFKIKSVLTGKYSGKTIEVSYPDLKAHVDGEMAICPVKNGSNIEHDLKPRASYTLYLRSEQDHELLLAVPSGD